LFHVPVGESCGPSSHNLGPTDFIFASVADKASNPDTSATAHLGKIIIYSIRRDVRREPLTDGGLTGLGALEGFAVMLEHFFHPANYGKYDAFYHPLIFKYCTFLLLCLSS
jgi:hypothetical protein